MRRINCGRRLLISVIAINITVSIALTALTTAYVRAAGRADAATYELMQGAVRFALECFLFYFVYRGHRWARIVVTVLLGVIVAALGVVALSTSYIAGILAVPFIYSFIVLIGKPVKAYQEYRKTGVEPDV